MYKGSGIYINFYIDSLNLLFVSLQISLLGYTKRVSITLSDWRLYIKIKPWSIKTQIGPIGINLVDENKLTEYINKVLAENEDNLHSES